MGSCQPELSGPIGEPFNKLEEIQGDWKLVKVVQHDPISEKLNLKLYQMDISERLPDLFQNITAKFSLSENGEATNFEFNIGDAPFYVDTVGTWKFDDNQFPTKVLLTHPDSLTITSSLDLGSVPQPGMPIKLKFNRIHNDEIILTYIYEFVKL